MKPTIQLSVTSNKTLRHHDTLAYNGHHHALDTHQDVSFISGVDGSYRSS
jgi:hypothetical protein